MREARSRQSRSYPLPIAGDLAAEPWGRDLMYLSSDRATDLARVRCDEHVSVYF